MSATVAQVAPAPAAAPAAGPVGRRGAVRGVGLVLPADWWLVPLGDPVARRRAVDRLVTSRTDLPALLRRQLRTALTVQTARAASRGGWLVAFMLGSAGGVPLPLTLTASRAPGSWADEQGRARTRTALVAQVGPADGGGRLEAGSGPFGLVLRTVRERPGALPGAPRATVPLLLVEHWTDPGDGHGLVRLTASTPLLALRDACLDLCDAVASTLHPDGTTTDDAAPTTSAPTSVDAVPDGAATSYDTDPAAAGEQEHPR